MRKIVAVVQPYKLEAVRDALHACGVQGMTVTEVMGCGRQHGHVETSYRGTVTKLDLLPKLQVEVVVENERADAVIEAVEAILASARTGGVGDGKLFVYTVIDAVRVRTGERGTRALTPDPLVDEVRSLRL